MMILVVHRGSAVYAVPRSFVPLFQTPMRHACLVHRPGLWKTKESEKLETLQRVHWCNQIRLLGSIGCIPPAEAEEEDYRQLANGGETSVST